MVRVIGTYVVIESGKREDIIYYSVVLVVQLFAS